MIVLRGTDNWRAGGLRRRASSVRSSRLSLTCIENFMAVNQTDGRFLGFALNWSGISPLPA